MATVKPQVSDEAVKAKTGRDWAEWFALLDEAGAQAMPHPEIAAYLQETHGVDGWWAQMVTVSFERARGLRDKHQQPDGFAVSRSRTLPVPVSDLFRAWHDPASRAAWLPATPLVVRTATRDKSMRITWTDGASSVEVYFAPKGDAKSQVSVQHGKLPDAETAAEMKAYWSKALDRLAAQLEA